MQLSINGEDVGSHLLCRARARSLKSGCQEGAAMVSESDPESEIPIEETEPTDDEAPSDGRFEISSFPADFTVRVMYEKWQQHQLTIPEFQRRYVWTLPQASRLIESLLLGLPIPQLFLYRERNSPKLLVVDGHQRLGTVARFYDGRFDGGRLFRLTGVDRRWNGLTYSDLSEDDRIALDDTTMRSIVIQQTRPDDDSSVYQIFERLNTSGTQLNAMEIRKALYHERAYPFLEALSQAEPWRQILGITSEDKRLRDVELVLRVLALADWADDYVKPMKTFITGYMRKLDKTQPDELITRGGEFAAACERVLAALGPKPFHLRGRLNVAALDAVMAVVLNNDLHDNNALAQRYEELKAHPTFVETTARDTSDASVVRTRFDLTREVLVRD